MRLRLNVQRHGLPPSLVVWTTGDPKRASNSTISQLLEKVNDVIPLESDDWGLEDYIVEINGYECLHFQELRSVFRDDDEVCIRPLLSSDLRARKISGRHQISQAGRHLIDGVPFGRAFFNRAADRPVVEIPPRKRRRLTSGDDQNLNGTEVGRQLMGQPRFTDLNLDDDDGDGDGDGDENFNTDNDSDGSVLGDEGSYGHDYNLRQEKRTTKTDFKMPELILSNGRSLPLVDRDGKPFPGQYSNALLDYFAGNRLKTKPTPIAKGMGDVHECDYNLELTRKEKEVGRARSSVRRSSFSSGSRCPFRGGKSVRFRDAAGCPSGDGCVDPDEESVDEEFQPDNSSSGSESDVQGEDEGEDEASGESSKSDSGADSETSDQYSSSSSSESTESEPEEVASRLLTGGSSKKLHDVEVASCVVAPGKGRTSTKRRNQRRRDAKRLTHLKKTGQLPLHATHADLREYIGGTLRADPSADTANSGAYLADVSLEAKREELLASIRSGGVEVGQPEQQLNPQETPSQTTEIDRSRESDMTLLSVVPTGDTSVRRNRIKLDIASSRRMLFGSLGFSNPKTREDEEKIRLGFARPASNDHRSQKHVNLSSNIGTPDRTTPVPLEKLDATDAPTDQVDKGDRWEDRIALKAVECCHGGVKLSTPPFPFRQRWDPHQQRYQRRTKSKKRKRNRIQYYNSNEYSHTLNEDGGKPREIEDDVQLNYDEHQGEGIVQDSMGINNDDVDGSLSERIMGETCGMVRLPVEMEGDLPVLPSDISSLPDFTFQMAQPGTVIAFKHLTISEDWQPHICGYRTAEVVTVVNGNALELSLARRDITVRGKKFDEETGERIWGKFEMPDVDEEADSGLLFLDFSELIDAKLIQQPQTANLANTEKAVCGMAGEVDPHLSSPVREEATGSIYRPLSSFLERTGSVASPPSTTKDQGDREVSEDQSPSQPLDPVRVGRNNDGTSGAEGHQSSNAPTSSCGPPGGVDASTERDENSGHDISQPIRDAGFGSSVVSLFPPSPPALGRGMPDGRTGSKLPVDAPSQTPLTGPLRSPKFSRLSSSPTLEDKGLVDSGSEQPSVHGNTERFDLTIASVGYPKLPEVGTSPRPLIDPDNHSIGGRMGNCWGQHSSLDVLTAHHQEGPQRVLEASRGDEGVLRDGVSTNGVSFPVAGGNATGEPPKADSSSSEKDYPSFEELIASGRPAAERVKEGSSTPQLPETEKNPALDAISTKIRNKTPTIKKGSQSPIGSQLITGPCTSGIIDLTSSPPTRDETDEDEDDVGLPLGRGWVPKRRTTLGGPSGTSRRKHRTRDIYSLG